MFLSRSNPSPKHSRKKLTKLPFFFLPNFPNILPNHFFILLKIMDGFVMLKCGGLLVALQTTETVVPSSNPASLTVKNSEDRQGRCVIVIVYCNISGQRGETSHLGKKRKEKRISIVRSHLCGPNCAAGPWYCQGEATHLISSLQGCPFIQLLLL